MGISKAAWEEPHVAWEGPYVAWEEPHLAWQEGPASLLKERAEQLQLRNCTARRDWYPQIRMLLSKGKAMALPGVAFSDVGRDLPSLG